MASYKVVNGQTIRYNDDGTQTNLGNGGSSYANAITSAVSNNMGKKTVNVQADGSAPSGLSVGDRVQTAGGTYQITNPNAVGSSFNPTSGYWSKLVSPYGAGASASSGTSRIVNAEPSGNGEPGLAYGDGVQTANGMYTVVEPGTLGASFNPTTGYWSVLSAPADGSLPDVYYNSEQQPQYQSQWQNDLNNAVSKYIGYDYDTYKQGSDYAALQDSYTRNGQRAMQDTLGQVSARTGGLASSYAGSAAQQAYGNYMTGLEDAARSVYQQELSNRQNAVATYMGLENQAYGQYADQLNQYNQNRAFDYGVYGDAVNRAYQQQRDEVSDQQYADALAYQKEQDAYSKQAEAASVMASAGDFSGYANLFGLSDAQTSALVKQYAREQNLSDLEAAMALADFLLPYRKLGIDSGLASAYGTIRQYGGTAPTGGVASTGTSSSVVPASAAASQSSLYPAAAANLASGTGSTAGTTAKSNTGSTAGTTAKSSTGSTAGTTAKSSTGSTAGTTAKSSTGSTAGTTTKSSTGSTAGTTAKSSTGSTAGTTTKSSTGSTAVKVGSSSVANRQDADGIMVGNTKVAWTRLQDLIESGRIVYTVNSNGQVTYDWR